MTRAVSVVFSIPTFLVSVLILVLAVNSFAQPNFKFTPSVTISEQYDSNVYSASSSTEDYVTRIGTNFNASYNGPNLEFKGGYLLNFNSYASQPEANVFTHGGNVNIGLNRWFQKFSKGGGFTITEDFTFTPDLTDGGGTSDNNPPITKLNENPTLTKENINPPLYKGGHGGVLSDVNTLSNYGIKTARSDVFRNSAGFNITLPVTQRLNLNSSYTNTLTDYSSPLYKDSTSNTLGLGAGYSLKKDTFYSNISISSARAEQEDSTNYSITFGVSHPFSQYTSLDVNTGISLVAPESGKNASTMRGSVGLTKRMEWHTFSTGYSRSINSTSGISGTPVIADVYYLNFTNIHSQYISSGIGANYSSNRSIKGEEVDTQSYNINGNLNYTIRKWLSCSFSLSHFNQLSQIATISDMKRNQITLSLVSTWL